MNYIHTYDIIEPCHGTKYRAVIWMTCPFHLNILQKDNTCFSRLFYLNQASNVERLIKLLSYSAVHFLLVCFFFSWRIFIRTVVILSIKTFKTLNHLSYHNDILYLSKIQKLFIKKQKENNIKFSLLQTVFSIGVELLIDTPKISAFDFVKLPVCECRFAW